MKILLIDHYDSFTYNLYHLIAGCGVEVEVVQWDAGKSGESGDALVLSPGPGTPFEYPESLNLVQKFYTDKPILGVCLGHQIIGECFGSKTVHAKKVMHGKVSEVFHAGKSIFAGVPTPFTAARYHSLILDTIPNNFEKLAWAGDTIMAMKHKDYPLFGVQFHPESFLTPEGNVIMKNFLKNV